MQVKLQILSAMLKSALCTFSFCSSLGEPRENTTQSLMKQTAIKFPLKIILQIFSRQSYIVTKDPAKIRDAFISPEKVSVSRDPLLYTLPLHSVSKR